jgi:hypothetical protein
LYAILHEGWRGLHHLSIQHVHLQLVHQQQLVHLRLINDVIILYSPTMAKIVGVPVTLRGEMHTKIILIDTMLHVDELELIHSVAG